MQLGLLCLAEGDYSKAEECFRTALQKSPTLVAAWGNLGITLQLSDQASEACQM